MDPLPAGKPFTRTETCGTNQGPTEGWSVNQLLGIHAPMSIEASMIGYYAERAGEYERIYQKPERQADLQKLRGFVESTFAGSDVFEVACGTGYWTEVLARSAASVVATDINEEVLAIARSKGLGQKVALSRGDAYALPLWPQRFTAGLSAFWWSHVPQSKLPDFLRGFHRVLAPGARRSTWAATD